MKDEKIVYLEEQLHENIIQNKKISRENDEFKDNISNTQQTINELYLKNTEL